MNILRWLITFSLGLFLSSCLLPSEKGKVSLSLSSSDQATRDSAKKSRASVNEVKLIDDQLIIKGSDLDAVVKAKVSQNGSDSSLSIISQTANELILSSSSKVALALNTLMSLTLEDAYGATVVEVTFNLPDSSVSTDKIGDEQVTTEKIADGSITAVKLNQMSASVGQLLRWNGSTWVASDLDALTYAGSWDASVGGNPNPAAVGGEYYIVSVDGSADPGDGNTRSWAQGDWIVFNDNTSAWDQISNSSDVTSFEGRTGGVTAQTGDYTWAMINKTTSSIGDIADVDLSTPATTGKVLKFDGTNWIADDDLSGGGAGSVSSSEIADGSIVDADVSGSAAIAWSKINKTGAAASDVGLGNVTNDAQLKAADLDDTTTLGTSTTKVPSQNAVKTYVDNAVTGMGSVTSITGGAGLNDGPITTTGILNVQVDDSTIEVFSDELQVKALGIGSGHLSANAVTTAKITDGNVTNAKIDSVADTKITTACSDGEILSASSGNFVCASASSAGNWTLSGSDLYFDTGKVTIGSNSGSSQLEVQGDFSLNLSGTVDVASGSSAVVGTGTSFDTEIEIGDALRIDGEDFLITDIADSTHLTLDSNHSTGASSVTAAKSPDLLSVLKGSSDSAFVIKSNGNIGLGTDSPSDAITLVGKDLNFGIYDPAFSSTVKRVDLYAKGGNGHLKMFGSSGGVYLTGQNNIPSYIDAGNFGIGTKTPSTKLEVDGVITATGFSGPITSTTMSANAGTASSPSYTFSSDANTGFYSTAADTIEVSVGGSNVFDMSSVGLVSATTGGASVSSANGTASVPTFSFAGDEDTGWFSPVADHLAASTGGSERIRIDSSGNIAIGTTTTSAHLEVNGSGDQFIEIENTDATSSSMITFKNTTDTWNAGLKLHSIYPGVDTLGFSIDDDSTSRFFIDDSGRVGLGYTKPTAGLHFSHERRDETDILDDLSEYKINLGCSIQQSECKNVSRAAGFSVKDATSDNRFTTLTYHGYAHEFFATPAATYPALLIDSGAYLESGNTAISIRGHSTESDEFALKVKNSLSNPLLSVLNSGEIGIGTNSPSGLLSGTGTNRLHLKSSNGSAEINIEHTGTSIGHKSGVSFSSSGNQVGYIRTEKSTTSAHDASLAIGTSDGTTLSEKMRITQTGNVGIGTNSPSSKFHVSGTGTTGSWGSYDPTEGYVRIGESNDGINLGIDGNSIVGDSSISIVTTTANPIVFGTNNTAQMRITSDGRIGIGTTAPEKQLHLKGDGYILLENSGGTQAQLNLGNFGSMLAIGGATGTSNTINIDVSTGYTGIGIGSPTQKLDVGGNIAVSGSTVHTSDRRLKRDIASLDNALEKVTSLEGVTYNWKDENRDQHRQIGVIAQDVKKVFPEAVYENKNTGFLSVNYSGLIGALIESIKELFSMDKEQNRKIAALEDNNEVLREEYLKIQKENEIIQHENQQMKLFLCEQYPSADFCP